MKIHHHLQFNGIVAMIGEVKLPHDKQSLIKSIQSLRNPKIDVIEVTQRTDKAKLVQAFDKKISKGSFSVVFVSE